MSAAPAPGAAIRIAAPAKLNLYLHVTGRRDDGYHTLDSLIAFAGVRDVVEAAPAEALIFEAAGPQAGALGDPADNLVLKAARALAEAAGTAAKARLRLTKNLPVASGIGGGSADAAATLRALVRLWRLALPEPELAAIALRLGADVPMCLAGRAAQASGIGELLRPAPALPAAPLVLVNPARPLATPAVFKARRGAFSAPAPLADPVADAAALALALNSRRNDLTDAAIALEPAVERVLRALAAQPGCLLARMSGSGATCFGIFATQTAAQSAAAALRAAHPDWWVAPTRLLSDSRAPAAE